MLACIAETNSLVPCTGKARIRAAFLPYFSPPACLLALLARADLLEQKNRLQHVALVGLHDATVRDHLVCS